MMVKILLVQVANMNLGDTVLADNNAYLIQRSLRKKGCKLIRYSISSRDVSQIEYVDAVVFAGGILKTSNELFCEWIPELLEKAEEQNVPVFFSAIGAEPFDAGDERGQRLREAINLPCVKGISVRDDIEVLKQFYITRKDIRISKVCDPAVWCEATYVKELAETKQGGKVIGLGITRAQLFADYGNPQITKEMQLEFWKQIILELERKKLPWVVFTNGDTYDERMALDVLKYVGHGAKIEAPRDGAALTTMISQFRGVIAGRMHSNIIAYSLGIPSVGFIWNKKLRFWGKKIGHPERFFEINDMNASAMVNCLMGALVKPCGPGYIHKFPVYFALRRFLLHDVKKREAKTPIVSEEQLKSQMMATALGGIDIRYRNTNSKAAMDASLKQGYRNYEVDIRLTLDQQLVCVKRWNAQTFHMLNKIVSEEESTKPITAEEYAKRKCYNRFETQIFEQFIQYLAEVKKEKRISRVILDVGKPNDQQMQLMSQIVWKYIDRYKLDHSLFFFKIERKKDVDFMRATYPGCNIIYQFPVPSNETDLVKVYTLATQYALMRKVWIGLGEEKYTEEVATVLKESNVKYAISTFVRTDRMMMAIQNGATLVGSHIYGPEYIKKLMM